MPDAMDEQLQELQSRVLRAVAGLGKHPFALAGGTALERYYFHHRFSRDLDFFSPRFDRNEIKRIVAGISAEIGLPIAPDTEFSTPEHARVARFITRAGKLDRPLRMDFVEDVICDCPRTRIIHGVPVYEAEEIYHHKINAVAGTRGETDATGREMPSGRNAPRDAVDIFYLSRGVKPLHMFLGNLPRTAQRMFVRWAQTYSRMDMKLGVLELDIYDRSFDVRDMIQQIDHEVEGFVRGVV